MGLHRVCSLGEFGEEKEMTSETFERKWGKGEMQKTPGYEERTCPEEGVVGTKLSGFLASGAAGLSFLSEVCMCVCVEWKDAL